MPDNSLNSSSEFFQQLFNSLEGYAILSIDKKGIITSWNASAQKLFGYKNNEIVGKSINTLFTPDYIKSNKFQKKIKRAEKEGSAEDEKWYVRKDEQTFWGKGKMYPLRDQRGRIKGFTKILRDMTGLEEASKNRIRSNLIFLSQASKSLSASLDYETTLKGVAALAVPQISDWCSIDMIGDDGKLHLVAVAHKDPDKVKWARELRKKFPPDPSRNSGVFRVLRTGKSELYPQITEKMILASNPTEREKKLLKQLALSSVMIVPMCIESKCIGAISFIDTESKRSFSSTDLSMAEELASRASLAIENAKLYEDAQKELAYRKKVEEDLRQSEAKFKALYNANIVGIIYTNMSGRIIESNDAFLEMIGYSRKDLKDGKLNWSDLTPDEYKDRDEQAINELLQTGVAQPWEKEYIRKDGSQVPIIIAGTLLKPEQEEIIAIVLDITERKKLEQRKDEFIGIASHELKTPLTSIKGYTQILERIILQMGDEKLKLYLEKTNTYIDRLNSLIADLLDVSKIQAGKLQMNFDKFDFDSLVNDSIESIQHLNTHHKIIRKGEANAKINGDRHRLEQVFTNLLSNAIKYSPKADKVIVDVTRENNHIKVSVQDFGVGIPRNKQDKLFDRFYRVEETAKTFSGLGIGLYISCEIVGRHKGKMWVASEKGKGSTFYFTLPINIQVN